MRSYKLHRENISKGGGGGLARMFAAIIIEYCPSIAPILPELGTLATWGGGGGGTVPLPPPPSHTPMAKIVRVKFSGTLQFNWIIIMMNELS